MPGTEKRQVGVAAAEGVEPRAVKDRELRMKTGILRMHGAGNCVADRSVPQGRCENGLHAHPSTPQSRLDTMLWSTTSRR